MCERQKGANTQGTQVGSLASHETTKTKFHHQKDKKVEDLRGPSRNKYYYRTRMKDKERPRTHEGTPNKTR
jgi:hypothetical protein